MVQLNDTLSRCSTSGRPRPARSRSDLIREAIEQYYKEDIEAAIDRAMVEGYTCSRRRRVRRPAEASPADRSPRSPGEPWRGLVGRHPDAGRRPYLIMTRQAVIPMLRKVTAVPATSGCGASPRRYRSTGDRDAMPTVRAQLRHHGRDAKGWFVEPMLPFRPSAVQACRALAVALGC